MSKEKMRVSSNVTSSSTTDMREMLRSVSDVVALCTCQQSKDFPYCDGTHNTFNKATNSNMQPLYLAIVEGICDNCGSKGLSQSMDQISERRGCTITLSDSANKLHNSTSSPCANTCRCNTTNNKLSSSSPGIYPLDDKQTIPSSLTTKSATTGITPTDTTPTPITPAATKQHTIAPHPNNCNITEEKVASTAVKYKPSSIKSPINQKNIITRAEVAEHATQDDLWMIIQGNVYNITDYVQYHPGGVRALVKFAGKDGTDNVHYHSSKMLEILDQHYFIGRLPKSEGGGSRGCIIS